jgi:hypothetical protein
LNIHGVFPSCTNKQLIREFPPLAAASFASGVPGDFGFHLGDPLAGLFTPLVIP